MSHAILVFLANLQINIHLCFKIKALLALVLHCHLIHLAHWVTGRHHLLVLLLLWVIVHIVDKVTGTLLI